MQFSEDDLKRKKQEVTPVETLKYDAKWDRVFRDSEYLHEKEFANTEYWTYPDEELDSIVPSEIFYDLRVKATPTL